MKSCTNCRHAYHKQVGYSDYTIEGVDLGCLENLNPRFPVDAEHPGEAAEFGEHCAEYRTGKPQKYSVEEKLPESPPRQYHGW